LIGVWPATVIDTSAALCYVTLWDTHLVAGYIVRNEFVCFLTDSLQIIPDTWPEAISRGLH